MSERVLRMQNTSHRTSAEQRARLESWIRREYPNIRRGTPEWNRAVGEMMEKQAWQNFMQTGADRYGSTKGSGGGPSGGGGSGGR